MESLDHEAMRKAEAAKDKRRMRQQRVWKGAQTFWRKLATLHRRGNRHFAGKWSDGRFTALAVAAIFIVMTIMLWFSPYLGVANDGTVTRTMQNAGLSHLEADAENANNYFTRTYQLYYADTSDRSFQLVLIEIAKAVDSFFTGDRLFDIRFLSAVYALLAAPAWALLIRAVVGRADAFLEKCVLSVLCVLILADVSYITYFNSLYPEAIFMIGLSYLFGGGMMMQKKSRFLPLYWLAFAAGALMLCTTRQHGFIIAFLAALFCIFQLRLSEQTIERVGVILTAFVLLVAGLFGSVFIEDDLDDTSRVHAMTRGVLLQSSDPEKTLQKFGINGSYAMLTDASFYDTYALTDESEYYLQNGFLDHYADSDIALYYLRHPGAMASMLDLGVRSSVDLRRSYCGNYERTVAMPAQGKSIFFAAYSIFKSRSLPRTIAFPLLLAVVCAVLSRSGWWKQKEPDRFYYVYFCVTLLAAVVLFAHLAVILCRSGDAQLTQYNFIAGFTLDCLMLFTVSELLHRLNILEEKQEESK